ncbi:hypothetical protein JH25_27680 [Pseudomonas sp. BRG-100]|uniref:hypothetical protein n=1 Tax=Pseudomonas sp. BRG-100 TaxID=1524267 RepID=UPI0004E7BF76|nr:hypothetical protein [Pseudomonas sp. BRG-100]KFF42158.1 hypothetical protein JH25_27680 [Pseudomonas sp. BRG-100]
MIFDALAILNGLWGFLCIALILPALVARKYRLIITVYTTILIVNSLFLYFNQQMPIIEALLRSMAVVAINVLIAYLLAHFCHHKRSVSDLFRRSTRPLNKDS